MQTLLNQDEQPLDPSTIQSIIKNPDASDSVRNLALSRPDVPCHVAWWAYRRGTPSMRLIAAAKLAKTPLSQAQAAEPSARRWIARHVHSDSVIATLATDPDPVVRARALLRTTDSTLLHKATLSEHPGVRFAASIRLARVLKEN